MVGVTFANKHHERIGIIIMASADVISNGIASAMASSHIVTAWHIIMGLQRRS